MENTRSNNNTDANKIDLTNVREVLVYNEDGSIKETFWFPITPPPPIVIEDSSDTETEEEEEEQQLEKKEEAKEEQQEKKKEKEEEEKEKAAETEEQEQEQAKEEEAKPEAQEGAEEQEEEEAKEEEEEEQDQKRRRIGGPVPVRLQKSTDNRSVEHTPLQPAPTLTPAPIPSDLFPPPELAMVNSESGLEIELTNALATTSTSPVLEPVPTPMSPPTSPLPDTLFTMDIDDYDKKV